VGGRSGADSWLTAMTARPVGLKPKVSAPCPIDPDILSNREHTYESTLPFAPPKELRRFHRGPHDAEHWFNVKPESPANVTTLHGASQ